MADAAPRERLTLAVTGAVELTDWGREEEADELLALLLPVGYLHLYVLTVSTRRALKMRKSFFCLRSLLRRLSATLRPDSGGRPGPPDTKRTSRVLEGREQTIPAGISINIDESVIHFI